MELSKLALHLQSLRAAKQKAQLDGVPQSARVDAAIQRLLEAGHESDLDQLPRYLKGEISDQ